jgi:pyruvate ferredoxin oxidoreductase beta subunit
MSLKYITPAERFKKYLPKDYVELVDYGPFGKTQDEAGPGNMGQFKELMKNTQCVLVVGWRISLD